MLFSYIIRYVMISTKYKCWGEEEKNVDLTSIVEDVILFT